MAGVRATKALRLLQQWYEASQQSLERILHEHNVAHEIYNISPRNDTSRPSNTRSQEGTTTVYLEAIMRFRGQLIYARNDLERERGGSCYEELSILQILPVFAISIPMQILSFVILHRIERKRNVKIFLSSQMKLRHFNLYFPSY